MMGQHWQIPFPRALHRLGRLEHDGALLVLGQLVVLHLHLEDLVDDDLGLHDVADHVGRGRDGRSQRQREGGSQQQVATQIEEAAGRHGQRRLGCGMAASWKAG
jgi:hypothetical protein